MFLFIGDSSIGFSIIALIYEQSCCRCISHCSPHTQNTFRSFWHRNSCANCKADWFNMKAKKNYWENNKKKQMKHSDYTPFNNFDYWCGNFLVFVKKNLLFSLFCGYGCRRQSFSIKEKLLHQSRSHRLL